MKVRMSLSLIAFAAILLGAASAAAQGYQPVGVAAGRTGGGFVYQQSSSATNTVASAPSVTAKAVTRPSALVVTLKQIVSANNATTQYWLACGTSKKSLTALTAKTGALEGTTAVTATLSGLKPKTTYYFRLYASNAAGTTAGKVLSVTTDEVEETASATVQRRAPAGAGSSAAETTPGTTGNLTASVAPQ